mmetsp:Transcript_16115/g.31133  ORF Transcript_16115/g.31133 Transcript_16115/m.31133 type:complete len:238 (+) Transcript_16115:431-1144(+)
MISSCVLLFFSLVEQTSIVVARAVLCTVERITVTRQVASVLRFTDGVANTALSLDSAVRNLVLPEYMLSVPKGLFHIRIIINNNVHRKGRFANSKAPNVQVVHINDTFNSNKLAGNAERVIAIRHTFHQDVQRSLENVVRRHEHHDRKQEGNNRISELDSWVGFTREDPDEDTSNTNTSTLNQVTNGMHIGGSDIDVVCLRGVGTLLTSNRQPNLVVAVVIVIVVIVSMAVSMPMVV